ncbi:NAP-domain-containing protein, partial [Rozella allomycis CSF55]
MSNQEAANIIANSPYAMNLLQQRLGELYGRSSGYLESLPLAVRKRLNALRNLQNKHKDVEYEFRLAVAELEKQFAERYAEMYKKRTEIVTGAYEPTEEECKVEDASED